MRAVYCILAALALAQVRRTAGKLMSSLQLEIK